MLSISHISVHCALLSCPRSGRCGRWPTPPPSRCPLNRILPRAGPAIAFGTRFGQPGGLKPQDGAIRGSRALYTLSSPSCPTGRLIPEGGSCRALPTPPVTPLGICH